MRITIDGLDGDQAEQARDRFAEVFSRTSRKLRLPNEPRAAHLTFEHSETDGKSRLTRARRSSTRQESSSDEIDLQSLLRTPRPNASLLRLQGDAEESVRTAIGRIHARALVYDDWGLSEIDPFPRLALNFVGPPGTGKTLAAHYIAAQLGKNIIEVSYSDVVSKYFGEAAKNLTKLYEFAAANDAILFVDEAETLLSRRTTSSGGGTDHAVNSMRSQLLILIERTPILSIFASNLVGGYDPAFMSRLITVRFSLPDEEARMWIWRAHLPTKLPVGAGVDPVQLAKDYPNLNGRQIGRAVVEAAHRAALRKGDRVASEDFQWAIAFIRHDGLEPSEDAAPS
jgi:SpoVK/Ycf46/Vps4 family AAA+-type ATPase